MANVEDLTINTTLSFSIEDEREIDSVKSSFSVLQLAFQDLNKDGNEFLQTLKSLNIDSSTLQKSLSDIGNINPNLELVISANDQENVLDKVNELKNLSSEERIVEIIIQNSSKPENQPNFAFNFTPEERANIERNEQELENIADRAISIFKRILPFYKTYLENSTGINTAILITVQRLLLAGTAVTGALAAAPFEAPVLSFLAVTAALMVATGQADDFADATQQILSLVTLTDEQLQGVADRLKEATENAPDLEKILPDQNNLKLDLGPLDPEIQKKLQEEIDKTSGSFDEQRSSLDLLNGAVAMLGNGFVAGAGAQSQFALNQEQVNQTVGEGGILFEDAGTAAEGFGETVSNIDTSGGLFDGFKQGFVDFVEAVGESGELIANFFANTLSQMSQNFSDLFFNVIKGNFDSLADLAEQAFDSILKSFLDLVSAIATKQIVVSIGGLFGIGGDAGGGGDIGLIWENEAGFHENGTGIGVFERENGKNEVNFVVFDKNEPEWRLAA